MQICAALSSSAVALPVWESRGHAAAELVQRGWGTHQVPSVGFWCKSRSYSTGIREGASDLHQDSNDQYLVFNIHFATSLLRAAELQATAVGC